MNVIETEGLTKHYGKTVGVEDLSLQIKKGEIFGFLGPNGAGKTTTLRLLMGLLFPTRGRASVLGLDCWKDSVKLKRQIGYIPGDVHLYEKMTGKALIDYIDRFQPGKPALRESLIERLDFDVRPKIKHYSKGNKQKLAVIVALMHNQDLLVLDEPTSGLDPFVQQEVYKILREFKEEGKTIFVSSHILPEVEKVCDRVGILKEGHLVATEKVEDLKYKKIRQAELTFDEDVDPKEFDLPGVAEIKQLNSRHLRLTIKGGIDSLIKKAAQHKVVDFTFAHASLEDVFMEYYTKEKEE